MGDDITIGVTEIVNNIQVTAQPTDQVIDINVTDNSDEVTLNITPTVVEININKGSSYAVWGGISGNLIDQTDLANALILKADLIDGKVPAYQLPAYVDDVIEVANFAALPAMGEIGKIYVTLNNNKIYRWSGSVYIEIAANSAIWGAITGTLSSQTDLVNALNLRVPYTGATTNVDLGTNKLTASDLVINHTSGAGVAASITKGGNGEALTVVKSSGSGNAASITGGVTLLSELNLTTYLADDYIASAATWNGKQNALSGTGIVKSVSGTISYLTDNSTNWNTAFNKKINSAAVTGSTTKTLTLTQQDGSTITADWTDNNSAISIGTANGLSLSGTVLSLSTANSLNSGALSAEDFYTFTNKIGGSGTTNYIPKFTGTRTLGNSLIYDNGTNVGIGTNTPASRLTVNGGPLRIESATGVSSYVHYISPGNDEWSAGMNGAYDFQIAYSNGLGTPRMTLLKGGNVGIGTTSPTVGKLELNYNSVNNRAIRFQDQNGIFDLITSGASQNHSFGLYDDTNSAYRLFVTSSGNVGIGTVTPLIKFTNSGGGNSSGPTLGSGSVGSQALLSGNGLYGMYSGVSNNGDVWHQVQRNDANADVYNLLLQPSGGNVLIGTTTDNGAKLQVTGAATFSSSVTATGFFNSSDIRLKNIISQDGDVIEFTWKDGRDNKTHVGYIAQEVQKTMPDAVNEGEDGMLSVNYIEVLVKKIQDLENRIKQLEK